MSAVVKGRFTLYMSPLTYGPLCADFANGDQGFLETVLKDVEGLSAWLLEVEDDASEGSVEVKGAVTSEIQAHVVRLDFFIEDLEDRADSFTRQVRAQALLSVRKCLLDWFLLRGLFAPRLYADIMNLVWSSP